MATGRVPTTANSPLTAKGDLFTYSTAPARLAVGNNGESLVADSAATTGLRYGANFAAGKNKVINGDFNVWQRGTSFSLATQVYTADRWQDDVATAYPTGTISRQTFTPGAAPVAGYEGNYFSRINITNASGCTNLDYNQKIEDVTTFAGQAVTVSFWVKADAATNFTFFLEQNFGSGGSAAVFSSLTTFSVTSSWVRYSATLTLASISGKTIGTSSYLKLGLRLPTAAGVLRAGTYDIWGVQVEAGSVATAFQTATGTIQGELAACQRYYFRFTGGTNGVLIPYAYASTTTFANGQLQFPVPMRVAPTSLDTATLQYVNYAGSAFAMSSVAFNETTATATQIYGTVSGVTAGHAGKVSGSGATSYVGLSAEL